MTTQEMELISSLISELTEIEMQVRALAVELETAQTTAALIAHELRLQLRKVAR